MYTMKLGLGLGADPSAESGFNDANIAFCKQLGITHIIYSGAQQRLPAAPIAALTRSDRLPAAADVDGVLNQPAGGAPFEPNHEGFWRYEDLLATRQKIEAAGLTMEAIENFPPWWWDQVLLGGPGRAVQMENLKKTIVNMGRAGIGTMGYCFTVTGTWGRHPTVARGGAPSQGWSIDDVRDDAHPSWPTEGARVDVDAPISEGYVFKSWVESPNGPKRSSVPADGGSGIGGASEEEMWCADPCIPSQSIVGTPTASHA